MKNQTTSHNIDKAVRKFKVARESEPHLISNDILSNVERIKQQHQLRKFKAYRQPRLSENQTYPFPAYLSPEIKPDQPFQNHKQSYLSPPGAFQSKLMKKSPSHFYHQEPLSSKNLLKKNQTATQLKSRKSPLKNHKDSLNIIEEMLLNHGITLNTKQLKKQKSPRFSEPLLQDSQSKQSLKRLHNEFVKDFCKKQGKQKNLKETMSTEASLKNLKQIKLSDFEIGKELGKGKFGKVKIARHKKTGLLFSIKMIKKSFIIEEDILQQLIREIKVQSFINHSHLVKLYSVFDDRENIYLLLELCNEGNLYTLMQKKIKIGQEEAAGLLKEVCEGVSELHENNIVHRDIKPENIVMCYGMAKICDFGWAAQVKYSMRETFCGTPLYVSPELLRGRLYDEKVDIWAVGILGYEMITGTIPFRIKSQKDIMKIVHTDIVFPKWMSQNAKTFLEDLLEKDPKKRKQISEILTHQFLHKKKKQ